MLEKVKRVHVTALSQHVLELFTVVWEELSRFVPAYSLLFVDGEFEGKLVDSDGLPYTLDALVLEEIDFLASALKAKTVRAELTNQMKQLPNSEHTVGWLQELIRVMVQYSRIPKEEEGLWGFDANIYLCETTSVTANYTPRAACAELIVRSLMEWLKQLPIKALLHFNEHNLVPNNASYVSMSFPKRFADPYTDGRNVKVCCSLSTKQPKISKKLNQILNHKLHTTC